MDSIARRILNIGDRIARAAQTAGRDSSEITLVAVTKNVDLERIREAAAAGVRDMGENYYQEARDKLPLISPEVRWHFIGHLQSNKAKYIPGAFHLLQSIDNAELAAELDRRARQKEIIQNVLIEVKLDPAATKNGIEPVQLPALVDAVLRCGNLRLLGLMGIAPMVEKPESARPHFAMLRELLETLPVDNRETLSMGMTADFEAAIQEGSTMVRIGSAIFGSRNKQ